MRISDKSFEINEIISDKIRENTRINLRKAPIETYVLFLNLIVETSATIKIRIRQSSEGY